MMLVKRNYQPTFSNLVDEFFKADCNDQLDAQFGNSKPRTNIRETETTFEIDMLVPGFDKSDLAINVENSLLKVKVEKEFAKAEEGEKTLFREFSLKNFERSFRLSEKIDKEKIEARFNNGILQISVPKKEEALIKRMIEVK